MQTTVKDLRKEVNGVRSSFHTPPHVCHNNKTPTMDKQPHATGEITTEGLVASLAVTYNGRISDVWCKIKSVTTLQSQSKLARFQPMIEMRSDKVQNKTNNFLHELKKSTTTAAAEANNITPHYPHPSSHHLHNGILDLPRCSLVQC